ncbi:MAG: DUF3035 domain-containing protein [Alphaproteobacteria bacterium]|nr:DUF3035 domain-containing protein [Alphaproteobacteria bacterium]MBU6472333.1 DUF3035 domain-containing protein [Alphaproteobacteria bacterium]MDE2014234.1 DUF3035 domain-containing protein [Alphaproteobacteria bacterium]MDE2075025.1 DUF3035 domain-containing protein [Alphaproteobacteria bacterium]
MVKIETRRVMYLAVLASLTVALSGCQSFRQAAGLTKEAPDEFAVVSKAPLIIPPDYNLRPPRPGEAPTNQVSPTDAAEGTLYGAQPPATSSHGQLSVGEQALLAKAGATDANNMVRQRIAADNRAMLAADNSFTERLLFQSGTSDASAGTPLDTSGVKRGAQTAGAAAPAAGDTSAAQPSPDHASNGTSSIQDAIGSWLGSIF